MPSVSEEVTPSVSEEVTPSESGVVSSSASQSLSPNHADERTTPLANGRFGERQYDEIRALTRYIKETTLPTGGIKCFNDDDTKAFRRQASAIRRLFAQAEKDGHHEAVAYIKHHLFQGKQMRWEE